MNWAPIVTGFTRGTRKIAPGDSNVSFTPTRSSSQAAYNFGMDDKLKDLIAGATANVQATEKARTAAIRQADLDRAAKDRAKFYAAIQSALGPDVLASLGPLTYKDDFLTNAMHFTVNGKAFKVQQVTGTLANLEMPTAKTHLLQFQLQNPDAKDSFLDALGKALA